MSLYASVSCWIPEISDYLETQEMCDEVVRIEPYSLKFVRDSLNIKEMCTKAVGTKKCRLQQAPDL